MPSESAAGPCDCHAPGPHVSWLVYVPSHGSWGRAGLVGAITVTLTWRDSDSDITMIRSFRVPVTVTVNSR